MLFNNPTAILIVVKKPSKIFVEGINKCHVSGCCIDVQLVSAKHAVLSIMLINCYLCYSECFKVSFPPRIDKVVQALNCLMDRTYLDALHNY